ncbi:MULTISPECIES: hypothetical protein [unclassified Methylobacterium]|uniref:hypothetical protein n=1 Tax=unclassified Methylobacterium TaxID=2615210 RepID=UPI00226AC228|nr:MULTISPECIES: hypothetical protein [unclassified Methylobacterium]
MSANPQRRHFLGLLAATPLAAAAGAPPGPAGAGLLRRLSSGSAGDFSQERFAGLSRFAEALDRTTIELDIEPAERLASIPNHLSRLAAGLDSNHASIAAQQADEARAIAALALVYPPEIAAYHSFGAPMRRRLYAELLVRESMRLAAANGSPSTTGGAP